MTDRHAVQREIEDKLARAESALLGLKAKLGDAGHEAERGWTEISARVKSHFA